MKKLLNYLINWWQKNEHEEQSTIANYRAILKQIEKCRIDLKPLEKENVNLLENLNTCNLSRSYIVDEQLSENKRQQDTIVLRFGNDILHRIGYDGKYN